MCWERMGERWTDDVRAKETTETRVTVDDELERPETWREPTEEPIEAEKELARV
jgi:hypothetical protein